MLASTPAIQIDNPSKLPTVGILFAGTVEAELETGLGGALLVLSEWAFALDVGATGAEVPLALQSNPNQLGLELLAQVALADAGASHGLAFSRGLRIAVGH